MKVHPGSVPIGLKRLYELRFSRRERELKEGVWRVLCENYFQRFVPPSATVLDLACGFGEFSRYIRAARKLAVDLNPACDELVGSGVEFVAGRADDLTWIESDSIDVCFTSNFFEHLPDKATLDRVLQAVWRVLRPGGRFLVLQPNIKYAADRYWDFYDHELPLSHLSAQEGFELSGYRVLLVIPRFVPWSTKSRLPKSPWLVRCYLRLPFLWRLLGRQFLMLAEKPQA